MLAFHTPAIVPARLPGGGARLVQPLWPRPFRILPFHVRARVSTVHACASAAAPQSAAPQSAEPQSAAPQSATPQSASPVEAGVENARPVWRIRGAGGALLVLGVHLLAGAVLLARIESWPLMDALYFAVAVATTVGYGDLAPTRPVSRVFVALYALASAGLIGQLLARVVDAAAAVAAAGPRRRGKMGLVAHARTAERNAGKRACATAAFLAAACVAGAMLYGRVLQKMSVVDALYFIAITVTTVGLGDFYPKSRLGRGFATVWLVVASLGFANLVALFAEWRGLRAQRIAAERVLSGRFSEEAFGAMDDDGDGRLDEGEFLGYVMCKLGKATPDEVGAIMARFRTLDKDGSGFITKDEVIVPDSET